MNNHRNFSKKNLTVPLIQVIICAAIFKFRHIIIIFSLVCFDLIFVCNFNFFGSILLLDLNKNNVSENSVGFHDIAYRASSSERFLSDISDVKGASKLLLRLHGAFMLAAWIGTASLGTFIARYYRKTWVGKTICGKDLWFAVSYF